MTVTVPPPARLVQLLAMGLALGAGSLTTGEALAAPVEPDPSSPDPSSPDTVNGDLGAIDDGPDTAPDTNAPDAVPPADEDPPTEAPEAAGEPEFEPDEGVEYIDEDEGVEYVDEDDADADASSDDEDAGTDADAEPIRPPRVDGPYVGALVMGTVSFASVIDLDTPDPLFGGGGLVQAGDAVFPWMSIGIAVGGQAGAVGSQRVYEGALLVEFGFVPAKRYPLSIRAGFGFGGGRVVDRDTAQRPGFGGALFKGSLRYEFFPLAAKNRPDRGGGWAIGPELGWLGATPAAKGQPFVHTILLGVSTSFYFGS